MATDHKNGAKPQNQARPSIRSKTVVVPAVPEHLQSSSDEEDPNQKPSLRQRVLLYLSESSLFIFHRECFIRRACIRLAFPLNSKRKTTENVADEYDIPLSSEEEEEEPPEGQRFLESHQRKSLRLTRRKTFLQKQSTRLDKQLSEGASGDKQLPELMQSSARALGRKKSKRCSCTIEPAKVFENTVLVLIILSSLMLAIDSPLNDPETTLSKVLYIIDAIFTFLFLIESVIKIIAFGFIKTSFTD